VVDEGVLTAEEIARVAGVARGTVGFLAASATRQQASTRTSAPRIDVRQLEVPLLPLEDQERYATAFRRLRYLKTAAASFTDKMANLTSHLTTGLTVGEIRLEAETTS